MKLTDFLAIYGAILSTAIFFWSADRARPKLKVRLVFSGRAADGGGYENGIGISIQNPSAHAVHISNVAFLYPWRKPRLGDYLEMVFRFRRLPWNVGWCQSALSNHGLEDGCPLTIEPGRAHSIFVPERILKELSADSLREHVKVVVQDSLWRNKVSPSFEYTSPAEKKRRKLGSQSDGAGQLTA